LRAKYFIRFLTIPVLLLTLTTVFAQDYSPDDLDSEYAISEDEYEDEYENAYKDAFIEYAAETINDTQEEITEEGVTIDIQPSYMLAENGGDVKFIQTLSWSRGTFAVRYTIILERLREDFDVYTEVLRRNVDGEITSVNVSVPAGKYRYRVISYNVFNSVDIETPWSEFEIIRAMQPSILGFSPEAFYFDRATPRILELSGENLFPDTDLFLVSLTELDEFGEPLVILPREMHRNELGETARIIFNEEDLVEGKYEIVAISPAGLESRFGIFSIAIAKPYDINVSIGFTPLLTLLGYFSHFNDNVFNALSFTAKVSYIHFKWDFGNLGLEFSPSWVYLSSEDENHKSGGHLMLLHVNALFQYWIIRKDLSLNARAGIGMAGIFNLRLTDKKTGLPGSPYNNLEFTFNLGASVQWFFFKQFYMEGGLDYIHVTQKEIPMGFVRIGLFGGYQF